MEPHYYCGNEIFTIFVMERWKLVLIFTLDIILLSKRV